LTTVSPLSSITIAPEAGSERLRRVINKEFTDEQVVSAVEALLGHRVQTIKLYFMIGLPTESREDIEAIISIVERIAGMARSVSGRCNVNVSLSPFSPKAHTAFQWEEMESGESLRAKNILIKNRLRPLKNVKVSYRDTAMTLLESVMARGDRAVASVVYHAWEMGARFDGWNDHFDFAVWTAAAQQASLDFSTYLDAIPHDQELPWSIVSTGVDTDFLLAEQARAKGQEITPDCRDGTCYLCGACSPAVTMRLSVPKDRGTIQVPVQVPDKELVPQQARKYRFVYSKGSEVRFLGHLDMVAVLVRALVASGCSLAYSQGFQPHPRVSFGPPIACGVTAKAEAFDVMTLEELSIDVAAINAMLPLGLRIVSYAPAAMTGQSITASIMAGEYDFMPLDPIDLVAVRERIEQVVDAADLYVTVIKKNTTVQKNIRPLVMALSSEELDNGVVITATLSLDPQATCKPAEFIQGLFPEKSLSDFSVCRKACFVEKQGMLKPLDQEQPVGL
jgi:radical SAM-linked protein